MKWRWSTTIVDLKHVLLVRVRNRLLHSRGHGDVPCLLAKQVIVLLVWRLSHAGRSNRNLRHLLRARQNQWPQRLLQLLLRELVFGLVEYLNALDSVKKG